MRKSPLSSLLGIEMPLIQAPMAGYTPPELVAAVSNGGALGSLGGGYLKKEELRTQIKAIRSLTKKPFAVSLFIPESSHASQDRVKRMKELLDSICSELVIALKMPTPPYFPSFEEQIEVLFEEKVPIFSFTFGMLDSAYVKRFKALGTLLMGTATTLAEALALQTLGVDAIVLQGYEAGGHRGTFLNEEGLIGLMALIPQVLPHIEVPLIAAGGIMNGRGILAAQILGASGVQMGTAFLATQEASLHTLYKRALLNCGQDSTTITSVLSGKKARLIQNKFIKQLETFSSDILPYPIQNALIKQIRKEAEKKNNPHYLAFFAGQGAALCQDLSTHELLQLLETQVKEALSDLS